MRASNLLLAVFSLSLFAVFSCGGLAGTAEQGRILGAASPMQESAVVAEPYAGSLAVRVTGVGGLQNVIFSAPAKGPSGVFAGGLTQAVVRPDASGLAVAPAFAANRKAGTFLISAALEGSMGEVDFSMANLPGPASSLVATGGAGQRAGAGGEFAEPLTCVVEDGFGNTVEGASVEFTASSPSASAASVTLAGSSSVRVISDRDGVATSPLLAAGARPGEVAVVAIVDRTGVAPARFDLSVVPGQPAELTIASGGVQSARVGSAFGQPLSVVLRDAFGNLVPGASVAFTAPGGGAAGSFGGSPTEVVNTDDQGLATAPVFTAGTTAGQYVVTAVAGGQPTTARASFTLSNDPGPFSRLLLDGGSGQRAEIGTGFTTALSVRATDTFGNGIPGVAVTFTAPEDGGATGTFHGSAEAVVTADAGGVAAAGFDAGPLVGDYLVQASSVAGPGTILFFLSNTGGAGQEISEAAADRFLGQSGFGPTPAETAEVRTVGFSKYLDQQFAQTPYHFAGSTEIGPLQQAFFVDAISGQDQLRARVVLALCNLFAVSPATDQPPAQAMPYFVNLLEDDAFGSFLNLLRDVTLSPAMGSYLSMAGNSKGDPTYGSRPNENYGRELMQLFTIGLFRLRPDGVEEFGPDGSPVPTYDQSAVEGNSAVLTGWNFQRGGDPPAVVWDAPMVPDDSLHDETSKTIVDGIGVPPGGTTSGDLEILLGALVNDSNTPPFVCKQLIQALVESNPSSDYVSRVASVFEDDGSGVRGNLEAVVRAILLDPEAREATRSSGHLMSPALYVATLLHELGATTDGVAPAVASAVMGEDIFLPPSVFGFYAPSFAVQFGGSPVTAPEFQLETYGSEVQRQIFVHRLISGGFAPGTTVDLDGLVPVAAGGPAVLLSQVDGLLSRTVSMNGGMDAIIAPLLSGAGPPALAQIRDAIEVIATSPQYVVGH